MSFQEHELHQSQIFVVKQQSCCFICRAQCHSWVRRGLGAPVRWGDSGPHEVQGAPKPQAVTCMVSTWAEIFCLPGAEEEKQEPATLSPKPPDCEVLQPGLLALVLLKVFHFVWIIKYSLGWGETEEWFCTPPANCKRQQVKSCGFYLKTLTEIKSPVLICWESCYTPWSLNIFCWYGFPNVGI